ncbi:MAG: response regulator [Planctomycetia bacterium]|nr:response regulator [Planctomycetia bacterium]
MVEGSEGAGDSLRVLVVDDNAHAADVLAKIIRLWGHETRVTHDGPGAIDEAKESLPDVVLLDIGLPGMDGYAVAREIRREHAFRRITLVALTGYGREEDLEKAAGAGFDRHMLKPVPLEDLERLLADLAAAARPGPGPVVRP